MREERERSGLARDVAQHQVDEAGLDLQARDRAGPSIAARSPSSSIGPSRRRRRFERGREPGHRRAEAEEVGAHREHHEDRPARRGRGREQRVDEAAALGRVVAERERLFELVDEHDEPLARRCGHRGREPGGSDSSRSRSAPVGRAERARARGRKLGRAGAGRA